MTNRLHLLQAIHDWDVFTFRQVIALPGNSQLIRFARGISRSGDGYLYPFLPLALLPLGIEATLAFTELLVLSLAVERTAYVIAKHYFRRRRPANILPDYDSVIVASDEFSFPSGHSSAAFLVVTVLVLTAGPMFALLYPWAGLVAISRVVVGVHFPSDILVGSLMGTALALLTCELYW